MDVDNYMDENLPLSRKFSIYPTSYADPTTVNRDYHSMDRDHILDESRLYVSIVSSAREKTNHAGNSGANEVMSAIVIITKVSSEPGFADYRVVFPDQWFVSPDERDIGCNPDHDQDQKKAK